MEDANGRFLTIHVHVSAVLPDGADCARSGTDRHSQSGDPSPPGGGGGDGGGGGGGALPAENGWSTSLGEYWCGTRADVLPPIKVVAWVEVWVLNYTRLPLLVTTTPPRGGAPPALTAGQHTPDDPHGGVQQHGRDRQIRARFSHTYYPHQEFAFSGRARQIPNWWNFTAHAANHSYKLDELLFVAR